MIVTPSGEQEPSSGRATAGDLDASEVWGLVAVTILRALLLALVLVLRRIGRALFGRKPERIDWEEGLRENLDECPVPMRTASSTVLLVHHLPAQLRMV